MGPWIFAIARHLVPDQQRAQRRWAVIPIDWFEQDLHALGEAWRSASPASLRRRAAEISTRAAGPFSAAVPHARLGDWRRSAIRVGAAFVGATTVVVLLIPGARVTLARQVDRLLQVLQIAPSTDLVTYGVQSRDELNASLRQTQRRLDAGRMWHVSTIYGGFGGSVREGVSPDPRRIDRPDLLSSLAPTPLMVPGGLHRGEHATFHYAWLTPDGVVIAFFGYGEAELLLVQAPVGQGRRFSSSRVICCTDGGSIGVPPAAQVFSVNGQQLTWDPDTTGLMPNSSALRWEANGVSYSLYGRALTREEAVTLFTSLRPLN